MSIKCKEILQYLFEINLLCWHDMKYKTEWPDPSEDCEGTILLTVSYFNLEIRLYLLWLVLTSPLSGYTDWLFPNDSVKPGCVAVAVWLCGCVGRSYEISGEKQKIIIFLLITHYYTVWQQSPTEFRSITRYVEQQKLPSISIIWWYIDIFVM